MELIENEPREQGILPEPEPRYHTEVLPVTREEHGQTWLRTLVSILVGLILIVLIVLLARWIYHKAHHSAVTVNPPTTTQSSPATSSSNTSSGNQPANTNSGTPATASPSNSTSTSTSTSTSANSNLPNSGPGDVAAIFAGTSLAAAGLHYIVSLRRLNRSNG